MAQILSIENNQVRIGTDDGQILTVPVATVNYPNPQPGDRVDIYQDGGSYIIQPSTAGSISSVTPDGGKSINKHIFVWVCSFLFGGLGVDRFVRGQIGLGICKLLFGWLTLGIWDLVDWIIALTKAYGDPFGNQENLTFDAQGKYTR